MKTFRQRRIKLVRKNLFVVENFPFSECDKEHKSRAREAGSLIALARPGLGKGAGFCKKKRSEPGIPGPGLFPG